MKASKLEIDDHNEGMNGGDCDELRSAIDKLVAKESRRERERKQMLM